ncbi:MAG: hypothetical protein IPQ08_06140 [Chitinophagaceae bacterium]|nr:hypothetical protein [Chitinophagaceae bacterium]
MKVISAGLNDDVVTVYDKTKTTILNVTQKTVNSNLVLGPILPNYFDSFVDSGITPTPGICYTKNDRLFVLGTFTAGLATINLYDFNSLTGVKSYVGKITVQLPNQAATTHTVRALKVFNDAGATNWKIAIQTTGSVLINGGTFVVNKVDKADFGPVSFTAFPMALTDDSKSVYFYQATAEKGSAQLNTTGADMIGDTTNNKLYVHNGVSATHQYYSWDMTLAPTIADPFTCTTPIATPGVVNATGHNYVAGDQVVFSVTGGALPTGLVAGTVYFVIATGLVAGVSFEVSLTSGGAAINFTGSSTGTQTVKRGFGQSTNAFIAKTGNLPALAGTLLLVNTGHYVAATQYIVGADFGFFSTSTNIYMGKLSELTSGATTWPSLIAANILGGATQIVAPTAAFATYSAVLDKAFIVTTTGQFISKGFVNSVIDYNFGAPDNTYFEANNLIPNIGMTTISAIESRNGWLLLAGSAIGQRGVIANFVGADVIYDTSTIITKVLDTTSAQMKFISTLEELFDITGTSPFYYRSATTAADAIFNTATGGWIQIEVAQDLSSFSTNNFTQFKIDFNIMSAISNIGAQLKDLEITVLGNNELSDNWQESGPNTTQNTSPAYSAFRLAKAYATSVPTLFFRAYDDSGNLVVSANTVSNPTLFEYSTTNGGSWIALGTIPNTPLTTEVRYKWASPPGVIVVPSIRES